ncbi:MAG: M14 family metallocarboxypeptidase, partial [Nitrospinota bacterium]|nr:M14 family metallocarboxypeptidase [Nitrospinota bacterium]
TLTAGNRNYPLIKIILGKGNPRRALISGGIHGDEPGGVETICAFLENKLYANFLKDWEFTLLPCINPSGYEAGTRNNFNDIDLNRKFKEDQVPREVAFVKNVLDQPYDLDLELHEDIDSPGYYLYQKDQTNDLSSIGRVILDRVESIHPLNLAEEIEEIPAERGLLSRLSEPDEMEWWPMALYAYTRGCRHVFTLETSPVLTMDVRIKAHLRAIQTALEHKEGEGA